MCVMVGGAGGLENGWLSEGMRYTRSENGYTVTVVTSLTVLRSLTVSDRENGCTDGCQGGYDGGMCKDGEGIVTALRDVWCPWGRVVPLGTCGVLRDLWCPWGPVVPLGTCSALGDPWCP